MNSLSRIAKAFSMHARSSRANIFKTFFNIDHSTKILDLGSGDGSNINRVLAGTGVTNENVYISDIDSSMLEEGQKCFGYQSLLLPESGALPFSSSYFDIVFCSSVIEHVTLDKENIWQMSSGKVFKQKSFYRQKKFAKEIRRVGKQYFVQTPYKYFPVETHTWLPFMGFLPRRLLLHALRATNRFWIKKTNPDWHLLNKREMKELFPDAQILDEKIFGVTKSIMAICTEQKPQPNQH